MKRILFLLALLLPLCAKAQFFDTGAIASQGSSGPNWQGILAPNRAMDWTANGATIINRSTQCGSTIAAYTGTADTINAALTSCAGSNQVVQLGAGTFSLSTSIKAIPQNETLRGMGPNSTFIVFTGENTNCNGVGATAVCFWNGDSSAFNNNGAPTTPLSGSFAKGSTSLTFGTVSGLAVGQSVIFTQNDINTDPGNIWPCQTEGANGDCSQQGGQGVAKAGASESQNVTVMAINGNVVTFFPGLAAPNWSSSQSPTAWWSSMSTLVGFGLEELSLDYSNLGADENGIELHLVRNCWVKHIRSINNTSSGGATHKHINIYSSNHVTVRDSYFYGASPTSEGYGVDNGPGSSNDLSENNIFQHLPTGEINETSCCNVFGYNFWVDNYYNNGAPNWQQQGEFHHGAGDHLILYEGDEGVTGFDGDDIHGTSFMLTHFRNYLAGHDPTTTAPTAPKNQATFAYFPFSNNRYYNAVGNVLGGNLSSGATTAYHNFYQNAPTSTTDCSGTSGNSALSVWVLGFGDQAGTGFSATCIGAGFTIYNDALVVSTLMRWGNYTACSSDAACNATRFQASENASGAPVYPGLSSPSSTLPASFYLSAKPSFWGSMPWPAVGGDVSGGNVPNVGGHAYWNPAANCYLNVMGGSLNGSTGALAFTCTYP